MVEHSRRQRVDLAEVAAGLQGILQPLAEQKGVTLQWDIPRELPALWLDPAVLRQIILNVAVAMLEQGGPGSMCVSACHDEGGIVSSVEYCSTLPPVQVDLAGESHAVARRLVENEGGSLRCVQEGAHVARMLITLPIKRATVLMIDDNPDASLCERTRPRRLYPLSCAPYWITRGWPLPPAPTIS
jgi:hypothetical protein